MSYDCDFGEFGTGEVTAVVGTDAPAALAYGAGGPLQVSSVVTVPIPEVVNLLNIGGSARVDRHSQAMGRWTGLRAGQSLTIPRTPCDPTVTPWR